MSKYLSLLFTPILFSASVGAEISINEIHYDPVDREIEAGSLREFVEIYNPGTEAVDLSGYEFSQGIQFVFPSGTVLASSGYLVVARDPTHSVWSRATYPVLGPYDGKLSNEGEFLQLVRPDTSIVEGLFYGTSRPWPTGSNGYGPSLERISWDLPSDDPHSWRASLTPDGSPGRRNSAVGTHSRPLIAGWRVDPPHPTSNDAVTIRIGFDSPETIRSANLRWTSVDAPIGKSAFAPTDSGSEKQISFETTPMTRVAVLPQLATYELVLPSMPSQRLVRFCAEIVLTDDSTTILPHSAERRPYESYFIYDGEIDSSLPILWKFDTRYTFLPGPSTTVSGVVILPVGATTPLVFDGASIERSRNGKKIKFIKGEEYRGDRTLNLIPESPPGGTTAGFLSPHLEHLAFRFFRDMGVLAPRADWYRVVGEPNVFEASHTQRLAIQQVNEVFLQMNGRDPNGYLFKRNYYNPLWEPHTRKEEGDLAIYDLQWALLTTDPEVRRTAIDTRINTTAFRKYSVASVLLTNWDGFHNNHWMYKGPNPEDCWEIVPWDLDKTWGFVDGFGPFTNYPYSAPLLGGGIRSPGPITGPLHRDEAFDEEYRTYLRLELDGLFAEDRLSRQIEEIEALLLDDLQRLEQGTGTARDERRQQILDSYAYIREYIGLRWEYLDNTIPPISLEVLAPRPARALFRNRTQILVSYDRGVEGSSAIVPENYFLDQGAGHPVSALLQTEASVLLTFDEPLRSGIPYKVSVVGVRDATYQAPISASRETIAGFYTPPVAITEIMYDNRGDDIEWVELFNTTDIPLEVSRWTLTDDDVYPAQGEGSAMLPLQTVLQPGETVVVNLWNSPYDPNRPDYDLWRMPDGVRVIDAIVLNRGNLDNDGDNLALFTAPRDGILVDGSLSTPFPDLSVDGSSLERVDRYFPWTDDLAVQGNFTACTRPIGFETGLNENNQRLSDLASPGRVATAPAHSFDIVLDAPVGRIDAKDLLKWFERFRTGAEEPRILFEFSRYWENRLREEGSP